MPTISPSQRPQNAAAAQDLNAPATAPGNGHGSTIDSAAPRWRSNATNGAQGGGDSVSVGRASSGNSFGAGFAISDSLKGQVKSLESGLSAAQQSAAVKGEALAQAKQAYETAHNALGFTDRWLSWVPGVGNDDKIARSKQAEASMQQAESALQQAHRAVQGADGSVRDTIANFLRSASGSNFAQVEATHREASAMRQSTASFLETLERAISDCNSAISAKQMDMMMDSMHAMNDRNNSGGRGHASSNHHRGGVDFHDMQAMSAMNEAQSSIARAQGEAVGFQHAVSSYRQTVHGAGAAGGNLNGIDVSAGIWAYFTMDNQWFGWSQISDLQRASGQLSQTVGNVRSILAQVDAHAAQALGQIDAQINAVRSACRA